MGPARGTMRDGRGRAGGGSGSLCCRRVVGGLLLGLLPLFVLAPAARTQGLSPSARIAVLTVAPGTMLHSLFGHTAVRVEDPAQQLDVVFNYGTFDFGPDFLPRFVYGELDYFLSVASFADAMAQWRWEQRSVSAQVLDLSPTQRTSVFGFLAQNARPENRVYRYDFLLDNCSTRVRDALARALGDDLLPAPPPEPPQSFRAMLDPYLAQSPFLHFGIDVLMGLPVDLATRPGEEQFLPDDLAAALDGARLADAVGGRAAEGGGAGGGTVVGRPLVSSTSRLYDSGLPHMPAPGADWASLVAWGLFALGIPAGARWRRWHDGALLLLSGVVGLLIALLWGVSLHHVTDDNLNLAWAWPTHLAVALPVLFGSRPRWLERYLLAAGVVALLCALTWPFVSQRMPVAGLPLALALGLRGLRAGRSGAA